MRIPLSPPIFHPQNKYNCSSNNYPHLTIPTYPPAALHEFAFSSNCCSSSFEKLPPRTQSTKKKVFLCSSCPSWLNKSDPTRPISPPPPTIHIRVHCLPMMRTFSAAQIQKPGERLFESIIFRVFFYLIIPLLPSRRCLPSPLGCGQWLRLLAVGCRLNPRYNTLP